MRLFLFALLLAPLWLPAQVPSDLYSTLRWRCIGPHRGGRTVGAVGVPQQPGVFYIGVNNGGVWKTDDYGRTWTPIFDDQPTGSVGDVAVAPSDPKVIYVASGEGLQRPDLSVGDGVYKSTDGGTTWTNTGLRDGLQIGGLAIDPTNPDRVFAAVLGHPYGPNAERGVFRTQNGGKTWEKVKFIDENSGAVQVTIDPSNPNVVYADFWANRLAPWENGTFGGPGSGLWKSTDGGTTWTQLTGGLPTPAQGLGRIGFCICPSKPERLYATVDCGEGTDNARQYSGIYRSDNGGATWYRTNPDPRVWGRGSDFAELKADPTNPDVVYSANVAAWKSTDGGKTWQCWRGAPGGDDYHRIWIHPTDPKVILLASDQGALVTVNGGRTFSSWYNQPTAQFYHVSTDNAFPYNVYGGQQESGSVCIPSRGNDGQITFREWHPVGVEEYGYVAVDPLDPNIVYGGKLTRHDKRTGQTQFISPALFRGGPYRFIRTAPVLFSPVEPHTLYFAGNVLFKTRNGGHDWQVISPDLTRPTWEVPACVGVFSPEADKTKRQRGVIYAVAPSNQDTNTIWAGTDDGLLHLTRDGGKNWQNITPPEVTDWSKVSQLDAGHFDNNTCYAAINRIRLDDLRPLILRTHDGGKTWQKITTGLPDNEPVNTVREDPKQPGLLFAGTERSVYVSFDDGAHWQSLRQNLPATSIRDLVVKDDDLVVGTHGRSFWILDNFSMLRTYATRVESKEELRVTSVFNIQPAYRVRWNLNTDTPLPQEEPAGQNPPEGAAIDYYLAEDVQNVTLKFYFEGFWVASYFSDDLAPDVASLNAPLYWVRPHQSLSTKKGAHRFYWDLHYNSLKGVPRSFPIAAVAGQTAPEIVAPMVLPGTYRVEFWVDGRQGDRLLEVIQDPRVTTSPEDLRQKHKLSMTCYRSAHAAAYWQREIEAALSPYSEHPNSRQQQKAEAALAGFREQVSTLKAGLSLQQERFLKLLGVLQESDAPATEAQIQAVQEAEAAYELLNQQWTNLRRNQLPLLNKTLEANGFKPVPIGTRDLWQPDTTRHSWQPLFTPNLSNATFQAGIWSVTNGELTATEDQCIWTKETYTNFVLDLDFKTADGTNSGVIVHCSDTDNWIPNSVEIQIADDYAPQWAQADPTWQCAAIFGHQAAQKKNVKRPGEWNHYRITCRDRLILVELNGELVNRADLSRWLSATTNPDGSAIPSWLSKPFATLPLTGHIGLQGKHAGAPIWFKDLKIKRLD